jgi:hypothetical protein
VLSLRNLQTTWSVLLVSVQSVANVVTVVSVVSVQSVVKYAMRLKVQQAQTCQAHSMIC